MSYDSWRAANPADEWLGPDPHEGEEPSPSAVIVTHCAKASPPHQFDYEARIDCEYRSMWLVVGYGRGEQEAITDLIRQLVGVR